VIDATLLWMHERPVQEGASYLLKIGTRTVTATVAKIRSRVDLASFKEVPSEQLALNEIGEVELILGEAAAVDLYREDRSTGGFVLIDRESFDTVGMGLVRGVRKEHVRLHPLVKFVRRWFASASESSLRSLFKAVSWRVWGSIDTTVLAFLFTGNIKLSAAIGGTEVMTKIALYYLHERLWTRVGFGKN
jgi:uncharacterized membrane protein